MDLLRNKLLLVCYWIILITGSVTMMSCEKDTSTKTPKTQKPKRVVIMYAAAENTLSDYIIGDIKEILQGCKSIPENDKFIIYYDNVGLPAIYEVTNKTYGASINSLPSVVDFQEDLDSASPETLEMIMSRIIERYPADSYGLILWSHGSGWVPYYNSYKTKSFGVDNKKNDKNIDVGTEMNISDMAQVLSKYKNIEYIMFDACFMQTIEVAYELRNATKYIIANPSEMVGQGAPYNLIMPYLFEEEVDLQALLYDFHDYYARKNVGLTLSAIDTKYLESFAEITRSYLKRHIDENWNFSTTLNYFKFGASGWGIAFPDMYDIRGLMQVILTDEEYEEWNKELNKLVPVAYCSDYWYSSYPEETQTIDKEQYSGVSMFLPLNKYIMSTTFNRDYSSTAWAKAVWRELYSGS